MNKKLAKLGAAAWQAVGSLFVLNPRLVMACLALALTFLVSMSGAHAALDAGITGAVTDVSGLWDDIKELVLGVVVFGIAVAFLRRSKKGS